LDLDLALPRAGLSCSLDSLILTLDDDLGFDNVFFVPVSGKAIVFERKKQPTQTNHKRRFMILF
jgi:hypothetical protein